MSIKEKEHYDLMDAFEKHYKYRDLKREPKDIWHRGAIYCHGEINHEFIVFRDGYVLGKSIAAE